MKSAVTSGMFAVCFLWPFFTASQATAQPRGGPVPQSPGAIALVDVNYLLKKNTRLNARLKCLRGEEEKVQKDFKLELQQLETQIQQLGTLKPGTPEYEKLEEMLVRMKSRIQSQIILNRKSFAQREARLYYYAYRELTAEVSCFCQMHGVALVLNFDGDKIDQHNRDNIAGGIASKLDFYDSRLDLTPLFVRPDWAKPPSTPASPALSPGLR